MMNTKILAEAMMKDCKTPSDVLRGGAACYAVPWLNLDAVELAELHSYFLEAACKQAILALKGHFGDSSLVKSELSELLPSLKEIQAASSAFIQGLSVDDTIYWRPDTLRTTLEESFKGAVHQHKFIRKLLNETTANSHDLGTGMVLAGYDSLCESFGNTGIERAESLRSARAFAKDGLDSLDGSENILARFIMGVADLLTPYHESDADLNLQRVIINSPAPGSEVLELVRIMRAKSLWYSEKQDEAIALLVNGELTSKSILLRLEAIHLAILFGERLSAKKWIYELVSSQPFASIFILSDSTTRAYWKDIEDALPRVKSQGRSILNLEVSEWRSFMERVDRAEKIVARTILADKEPEELQDLDLSRISKIPVLDLCALTTKLSYKREQSNKVAVAALENIHEEISNAIKAIDEEQRVATEERDRTLFKACQKRQRTMLNAQAEIEQSDLEGNKAEKGCFMGIGMGCAVFAFFVVTSIYLAFKGFSTGWESSMTKICFGLTVLPLFITGLIQVGFTLKRFCLSAKIQSQTTKTHSDFVKSLQALDSNLDERIKEFDSKRARLNGWLDTVQSAMLALNPVPGTELEGSVSKRLKRITNSSQVA